MPEMGAAFFTGYFCSCPAKTGIGRSIDAVRGKGGVKTRPSGTGIKLGGRSEQITATADALVKARLVVAVIPAGKRRFGSLLPGNVVLLRGKYLFPVVVILFRVIHPLTSVLFPSIREGI
jgi:hypothetical protein